MDTDKEFKKLLKRKGNNSFVFHGKAVEEVWGSPCIVGTAKSNSALVEMVEELPPNFEGYVLSDGQLSAVSKEDAGDVICQIWRNID